MTNQQKDLLMLLRWCRCFRREWSFDRAWAIRDVADSLAHRWFGRGLRGNYIMAWHVVESDTLVAYNNFESK